MRDKLVELIDMAQRVADEHCWNENSCIKCGRRKKDGDRCYDGLIADILADNGATVPQWIPVSEKMPDADSFLYISRFNNEVHLGQKRDFDKRWIVGGLHIEKDIRFWMPLLEPPKELKNG